MLQASLKREGYKWKRESEITILLSMSLVFHRDIVVGRCSEVDSRLLFDNSPFDDLFETSVPNGLILGEMMSGFWICGFKIYKYIYNIISCTVLEGIRTNGVIFSKHRVWSELAAGWVESTIIQLAS